MIALDLFSGVGWGVALRNLGIEEKAVDIMPEVVNTRAANGMTTWFHDVWAGLGYMNLFSDAVQNLDYELLIGGPPCQTFSSTGNKSGLASLGSILGFIRNGDYSIEELSRWRIEHPGDARNALVLTPLAYIARDEPTYIVMEQVPAVLPIWDAYAQALCEMGYSAWAGILNAEEFGVPQSRKRAFLIARKDNEWVVPPRPTHSHFYPHDDQKLDAGVKRWVSMSDALGKSEAILGMRSNYGTRGVSSDRGIRWYDRPAPTMTSKSNRNKWVVLGYEDRELVNVTTREAAILQTFPESFQFVGDKNTQHEIIGNAVPPLLAQTILESLIPA